MWQQGLNPFEVREASKLMPVGSRVIGYGLNPFEVREVSKQIAELKAELHKVLIPLKSGKFLNR